jgi:arginyl-tRNA--protein-N-Asp/Glu arginylyltransferase
MKSLITFISPPEPCEYLPHQTWQLEYEIVGRLSTHEYAARLQNGWRRFGHAIFRPACPSCRMCQSLRVPAATFQPDRSQRRAWKTNHGILSVLVREPSRTPAKEALRQKFQTFQHHAKGWPLETANYEEMFVNNPFPTEEWCYYSGDRLIAVGYVDRLAQGLSAIYFFYDPDERHRSLGTFNILTLIEAARERRLPYVYLGYYVEGCRSLEYKARFAPSEVLRGDGVWAPFTPSSPAR